MAYGMCALCRKRVGCRFRQHGTWVVECEYFAEDPKAKPGPPNSRRTEPARREYELKST